MSFSEISQIAQSGMAAQMTRMNTIASNMANEGSATGSEETAYRARKPVFASVYHDSSSVSVQVLDVLPSTDPVRKKHEPGNPLADAEGNVYYSNVNMPEETADLLSTKSGFLSNVDVLVSVKRMQNDLLKLGE